jgi:predicted MFS family arabinose efflux permease
MSGGPGDRGPRGVASPVLLALGGLVALAAAVGIGRFIYTPILPLMMKDLGMSASASGMLASANFTGYLCGALLAAHPAFRRQRRPWLLAALAVSGVTTGAMAVGAEQWWFLSLRFAGGVASAFALVFASALVLDRIAAAGRRSLSALHFAGVGAGIAVSSLIAASLGGWGQAWRWLWLAGGVISLAAVFACGRWIPPERESLTGVPSDAIRQRSPGLVALITAYGLFGFGYVITATFLVVIVRHGTAPSWWETTVWLTVGLTAAVSVVFWTWAARRLGIARAFAVACTLEAAGVMASVLWSGPAGALLAATLLGGTFMGITALGLVAARELSAQDPRRTLAWMTASFGLGQIIGPAFAGAMHDLSGSFLWPSLAAAGALLLAARLVLAVRPVPARG